MISANHLYIVPFTNTHHTATSHSRINHCFVSNRSFILLHSLFSPSTISFFSYHNLIVVALDCRFNRTPPRIISVCDLSKFNPKMLHDFLHFLDWAAFYLSDDLDDKVASLTGSLHEALVFLILFCTFCARRSLAPWIDRSIRLLMRDRDSVRRAGVLLLLT